MTTEFDELNAIVTGGASGIGAAVVRRLLSGGARVAVLDRDIATASSESFAVVADVADDASVRAAMEKVAAEFGHIDIVINNAGIGAQGTVEENDDAEWTRVLDVNVTGTARVTRAALPHLRESEHAAIVNISSIVATAGLPSRVLYSASKGAVSAMTRAMAADFVREGIRVNAVNPGTTDTPWVQSPAQLGPRSGSGARRARGPPAARPARLHGGDRRRGRLPREPTIGIHHGHEHRRRRRPARASTAGGVATCAVATFPTQAFS